MRLLDRLLDRAVSALPAGLHDRVIVFGSAPMVFAGLKADVTFDLDLFVDDDTFRAIENAGFAQDTDERGVPRIMLDDRVEVVSRWPGVEFADVLAASAAREGSRGLRVACLEHVLAFKRISEREKDQREARLLSEVLSRAGKAWPRPEPDRDADGGVGGHPACDPCQPLTGTPARKGPR